MEPTYERERRAALAAVREASRLCRSVQGRLTPELRREKPDASPVTVADFGAQALVCRRLRTDFPDDPVVGEETAEALRVDAALRARVVEEVARAVGEPFAASEVVSWIDHGAARGAAPRYWTLDPVDGTKGFLRGANYAVALALIEDGQAVLAALAGPRLPRAPDAEEEGVVFVAVRGQGATAHALEVTNERGVDGGVRLRVSRQDDPHEARWCESLEAEHQAQAFSAGVARAMGIRGGPRRLDSMLKYALVARGEVELYLRVPSQPGYREKVWDHAAGVLLIEEAGGRVTDLDGAPLRFDEPPWLLARGGVVASNSHCHEAALAAVRAVSQAPPSG
ncbi:MAG: 3'(2'),5'-bisphosphate nucleotidase [Planctomycetota bacterium]|nr:MAG: 3'(2'),5'-bisphosphate nucleotidase [Planctomycetota bacterium]